MSSSLPPKEALCYQCALRMSIMFQYPPPKSLNQFVVSEEYKARQEDHSPSSDPVKDDAHHPRFTIVHETPESVHRYLAGVRVNPTDASPDDAAGAGGAGAIATEANAGKGNSCIDGMFGGEDAPRHDVTWLCVACLGLYQFLDLVHAPAVAADVRRSPFTDSTAISVNVNVNRTFTFTWLTAATRYFDRSGTMTEKPRPTSVVPEELSNFKEFYMSDLRARVLQYLLRPHEEVMAAAAESKLTPGIATYVTALAEAATSPAPSGGGPEQPPRKHARSEEPPAPQPSAALPSPKSGQAFTYSAESDKLVCEVFCRHHPTERLITEEALPKQYCSNRTGCTLNYAVVYNYSEPFLTSIGWAAPADRDTRPLKREAATVSSSITHANIYLIGNYRKMMRNLSQSPWFANGARVGSFSLQEVIANPVLPFFFPEGIPDPTSGAVATMSAAARRNVDPNLLSAEQVFGHGKYKFHSAGREDVDVRMLGTGRPFVLEIVNPAREHITAADLATLEGLVNGSYLGSVEVFNLRQTDANITVRLARHSESKIKRYRCVVWCSRAIPDAASDELVQRVNRTTDLQIEQKTPLRVLHRRSLHARPRTIHSMRLTPLNAHWFILDVETQAGTYVKEFVHGDMGRTMPNLGVLLGARTDITQLDVVGMAIQDLDATAPGNGSSNAATAVETKTN